MVVQSFAEVGGGVFWRLIHILLFCFKFFVRLAVAPSWTLTGYRPARDLLILSKAKNHETIFHYFSLLFRGGGGVVFWPLRMSSA